MAFTSTKTPAGLICIGFGTPTIDTTGSTTTAVSPQVVSLTTFAMQGTIRSGWLKVRVYALAASVVLTTLDVTATDGTTTVTLFVVTSPTAATAVRGAEYIIPFMSELNLSTITVSAADTGGTTALTVDAEVVGNP